MSLSTTDLYDKYLKNTIKSNIAQPAADGKNVRGFESKNLNESGESTEAVETPPWTANKESIVGKGQGAELCY